MRQSLPPWVPYVVPFAVYLVLTGVEVRFPAYYPQFYTVKIVLATIVAFALKSPAATTGASPVRGRWIWFAVAVVAGVFLNWAWFIVDAHTPHPRRLTQIMGTRPAYDPFTAIVDPVWRLVFLAVRFGGLAVLIPYLEERFYRDFLLRYVIDPADFRRIPVGKVDPAGVAFSTILFASTHPEWLAAVVFGLSMCALVRYSKDIRVCMLAHGVTNLALGITVLSTGNWKYW